jgi:predicted unusual protein kinase regulating ubiquinone biosynthesis (AarF/ABC1/UbiB family)
MGTPMHQLPLRTPERRVPQSLIPAAPESAPLALPPGESPETPVFFSHLSGHGLRAYVRLVQILWAAALFALPLLIERFRHQNPAQLPTWRLRTAHRLLRLLPASAPRAETLLRRHARRLTQRLVTLGPTFIKVGQMLSTRTDLLPLVYTQELSVLQDSVPPFSNELAWARMREEFGAEPRSLFLSIDSRPLAAASLGQVYRARLKTGEEVVIKVQRPNLDEILRLDLTILRFVAAFLERHPDWIKGADWTGVVEEFGRMIFEETDYEKEIENAEQFRRNFAGWRSNLHIPKIYPELSSRRIITMEYIAGVKLTDVERLRQAGVDPGEKLRFLIRTYLKQLLEDGFFHADPHPGNLRIMEDGRLAFFDFGMVGQITDDMRAGMLDAFFHILDRDLAGLVGDAIALGFLRPGYDVTEFRAATQGVFEKYRGMKLAQLRFQELNAAVADTLFQYPFRIPGNFTFVIRALSTLEGMGLTLEPEFSLFDAARPHAKEFMLRRATAHLRDQVIGKLVRGEATDIAWEKIWNVARLAYRTYFKKSPQKPQ